jgi:hypothetical protein
MWIVDKNNRPNRNALALLDNRIFFHLKKDKENQLIVSKYIFSIFLKEYL